MERRNFIQKAAIGGAGLIGASGLSGATGLNSVSDKKVMPLLGNRFVTLCIMIRTSPWEVSRDVKLIQQDEVAFHTLKVVRDLREALR